MAKPNRKNISPLALPAAALSVLVVAALFVLSIPISSLAGRLAALSEYKNSEASSAILLESLLAGKGVASKLEKKILTMPSPLEKLLVPALESSFQNLAELQSFLSAEEAFRALLSSQDRERRAASFQDLISAMQQLSGEKGDLKDIARAIEREMEVINTLDQELKNLQRDLDNFSPEQRELVARLDLIRNDFSNFLDLRALPGKVERYQQSVENLVYDSGVLKGLPKLSAIAAPPQTLKELRDSLRKRRARPKLETDSRQSEFLEKLQEYYQKVLVLRMRQAMLEEKKSFARKDLPKLIAQRRREQLKIFSDLQQMKALAFEPLLHPLKQNLFFRYIDILIDNRQL